ncbi:hypothetical protein ABKN59_006496 [Abortiporus biennis]
MTFANLRALHALIGSAIDDIEKVYNDNSSRPSQRRTEHPPPLPLKSVPKPTLNHQLATPSLSPSPISSLSDYSDDEDTKDDDSSAIPTPISANFTPVVPSSSPPFQQKRMRSRAYTLPASTNTTPVFLPDPPLDFPDLDSPAPPPPPSSSTPEITPVASSESKEEERRKKSEKLSTHPEVVAAASKIVAACGQISAMVQKPFLTLCDAAMGYHLPACLRFLEEAHIVEMLCSAGSKGMHVKDIVECLDELYKDTTHSEDSGTQELNLDTGKLGHILRLLATHHITREVRPDVFANNRVSSWLDSGKQPKDLVLSPQTKYEETNGVAAFIGLCTDELFKASAYLTDCYLPRPASTQNPPKTHSSPSRLDQHPRQEPNTPKQSPNQSTHPSMTSPRTPTSRITTQSSQISPITYATPSPDSSSHPAPPLPPIPAPTPSSVRSLRHKFSTLSMSMTMSPKKAQDSQSGGKLRKMASSLGPAFSYSGGNANGSANSHNNSRKGSVSSTGTSLGDHLDRDSFGLEIENDFGNPPPPQLEPSVLPQPLSKSRKPSMASFQSSSSYRSATNSSVVSPGGLKTRNSPSVSSLNQSYHTQGQQRTPGTPHRMASTSHTSLKSPSGYHLHPHPHHSHSYSGTPSSQPPSLPTLVGSPVGSPARLNSSLNSPGDSGALEVTTKVTTSTVITVKHPMHAPFNVAFGTSKPYFEWLEEKGNEGRLKRFGKAMTGTGEWEVNNAVIDGFPWTDLPDGSVVVDVGGGIGSTSMLLANAFNHLKFVIQDRPQVVEMGLAAWKTRCPEMLEQGIAHFQAHDFFSPQPVLPVSDSEQDTPTMRDGTGTGSGVGREPSSPSSSTPNSPREEQIQSKKPRPIVPAVYLLRVITHDWPNAFVTRILLHLRQSALPDTKLLLADYILPHACVDEGEKQEDLKDEIFLPGRVRTLAPDGTPLLPNLGKANANAYWLDLTMRVVFNAQERTLRELSALTLTAGWKVVQVTRTEGSLFGHVIAVPVEIPQESLKLLEMGSIPGEVVPQEIQGQLSDNTAEKFSPQMGDTFFTQVYLPTDEMIRSRIQAGNRNADTTNNGKSKSKLQGVGAFVAGKVIRRKRDRAHTITSPPTISGPFPPLPPYIQVKKETNLGNGHGPGDRDRLGEEGDVVVGDGNDLLRTPTRPLGLSPYGGSSGEELRKKGWRSIVRMLSKNQVSATAAGVGSSNSSPGSAEGRLRR